MPSHDILDKLFDVEKKAEAIVLSARDEADRRIVEVKESCEGALKLAYEARVLEVQSSLEESTHKTDLEFKGELASYRARLAAAGTESAKFKTVCDNLLFGKA